MERAHVLGYARRVRRGPRIEVPSAREDELPMRSLIATSIACALSGLVVAYALAGRDAPHPPAAFDAALDEDALDASALSPEPPGAPHPADAGAHEHAAPAPEPAAPPDVMPEAIAARDDLVAKSEARAEIAALPEPSSTPDSAPPAAASKLRVVPGVFAYLRCDGLPQRRGRYPCPRDRTLEGAIRKAIEALPSCREAHAIARGAFDVRLEIGAAGTVEELHVRAPSDGAERAVRACAGPALRKEHTALRPTRMIVSMRFKAR